MHLNSLKSTLPFPLFPDDAKSLAKKYLTKEIYQKLIPLKTNSGFTLHDAVKSGIENPDSSIGIYAGDAESYELFFDLFKPIIEHYHGIKSLPSPIHPLVSKLSFTPIFVNDSLEQFPDINLPDLDPQNRYIISTRIRVARNLNGFPFTPIISQIDRKLVETITVEALKSIESPLIRGEYSSIEKSIICSSSDKSYFKKGDRFQESAGINRDWPNCRGIFESYDKKFMVWVNEEDHLRVISISQTGNIADVFNRLMLGVKAIDKRLSLKNISFAYHPNLGYLTTCPSNLGTGIRASVHIKLPNLLKQRNLLNNAAEQLQLQIRGTKGEKTEVESAIFDISNSKRVGVTEAECCQILYNGICKIIKLEQSLNSD